MGLNNLRSKASEKENRKFEKKVQFYAKVRSLTVTATQATKTISKSARRRAKKLKAYDLSSLSELLPELETEKKEARSHKVKLNNKSRQHLLLKEGNQLATVLSHPAFQSNPLGAIRQHLQSTQPGFEKGGKTKTESRKKKKKRGKKPVPASGLESESMEM